MRSFVFVLALCSWCAGVGCSRTKTTGITVDRAFTPLISPETNLLAGFDLDDLKGTGLYQRHAQQLNFPLLDASSDRVGLDPRRDISKGVIAWNGRESVVIFRGSFKPEAVQSKLVSLGAKRNAYRSYTLLGNDKESLVFLKGAVVAAGATGALHAALDTQEKGAGEIPEELQERLRTLPKDDQIWFVSRGRLPFTESSMRSDIGSALSNIVEFIRGATAGVAVGDGMQLEADLTCISEDGAKRVRDALKGGIGLARLTTKDNELELLRFWDAFQIDQNGALVHLRADLAGDLADKMLARLPELRSRANHAQERAQ